jgi:hypothetical protein
LTATAVKPEPIDCEVVLVYVASVLDVPHSNQADVAVPFGFTEPFSVPPLFEMALAAEVETVGTTAPVTKLRITSRVSPPPFCEAARK